MKLKGHCEYLGVVGQDKSVLKCTVYLINNVRGVDWNHSAERSDQWRGLVNTGTNMHSFF
jgi:hypothetical protein